MSLNGTGQEDAQLRKIGNILIFDCLDLVLTTIVFFFSLRVAFSS